MIIEIADGLAGLVASGEQMRDDVLGSRLAGATGDTNHPAAPFFASPDRKLLQSLESIGHHHLHGIHWQGMVNDNRGGSLF
jgi:hypothetical protein